MFLNIRVCVTTNMKLDKDYIEEWCEHYYNLGFTYIYILEDIEGAFEYFIDMPYIKDKVNSNKLEIILHNHTNQWSIYPMFYKLHGNEFEWCGFFDSDEFLTLNKHKNILDYLNDPTLKFEDADSILISWRFFNDNNQLYKIDKPVKTRFTQCEKFRSPIETKIIVRGNLSNPSFFIGHYCSNGNNNRIKFSDGTIIGKADPKHLTDYTYASIDHYFCKSTEEYIERKSKGRLDIPQRLNAQVLEDAESLYFALNEKTPEKVKMFEDKIKYLKEHAEMTNALKKWIAFMTGGLYAMMQIQSDNKYKNYNSFKWI